MNARLLLETKRDAVIVPAPALQRGPQGTFVFVVNESRTVEVRPVKAGVAEGNDLSLESGVEPDELVVVEGADRLQEGSKVEIRKPGENGGSPGERIRRKPK